ncbi:hypothetical protein BO71DRAFT_149758 [Aspergillus ellipticus CBS 707.79]|uniref:Uncharacterized protein n=1 Tax=Aspergillus ellipticus CBS 707.79 TaxID=1448320 RepID=A0A319DHY1_9EURO|nr:hypothetical protein BO71DRAFT_149758 [Aspergillus ellipticus CBS 707.79]
MTHLYDSSLPPSPFPSLSFWFGICTDCGWTVSCTGYMYLNVLCILAAPANTVNPSTVIPVSPQQQER